jgi:D-3-phosphoglycerate dehydrogenase / 2-oxoglutarate reductase
MPVVLITYDMLFDLPGRHLEMLREAGFEVGQAEQRLTTEAETIAALGGVSAVIAGGEPYSARVLEALPDLRVIARAGVGFDRVDLEAATRNGVVVTITPAANSDAVAEHVFAMLLALTRRVVRHNHEVRRGGWSKLPLLPLRGRALGIIGLGRIGRAVAVRAAAFRMKLLARETRPDQEFVRTHGITLVDLDTLLAESDAVTLHVPLTDETHGLINRKTLARMKRGSILINTSRGGLVVEHDLVAALEASQIGGVGLDVFSVEPTPVDNPLLLFDNVVVSPHLAGGDVQALADMGADAARSVIELRRGDWPEGTVVNPAVRPGWRW